jgi:hypothetical protein
MGNRKNTNSGYYRNCDCKNIKITKTQWNDKAKAYLSKATIDRLYTIEDLESDVISKRVDLWEVRIKGLVKAYFATRVDILPRGSELVLMYAGGKSSPRYNLTNLVMPWCIGLAKKKKYSRVVFLTARKGLQKLVQNIGFKETVSTMEFDIG